jgi:hypothetical protein
MQNIKKSGKNKDDIIKQEIDILNKKFQTTRGYSDLLKGKSDLHDENDLKVCSFVIIYVDEVLEAITKIIRKREKMPKNSFSGENKFLNENPLNSIHMLIVHYLDIFKEVLILNENNFIYGAISRCRSLLEMFFIFQYLFCNPESFERYSDHGFLRYIERSKEWKIPLRASETERYEQIKIKYNDEYNNFIKNYGWVKGIKNPNGIGGLIDLLTNVKDNKIIFYLKDWYKGLSEFSHSSFFIVSRPDRKYIPDFLPLAILYCLEMLKAYTDYLSEKFMLSEVEYLPNIIVGLIEIIINNIQPYHLNFDFNKMININDYY